MTTPDDAPDAHRRGFLKALGLGATGALSPVGIPAAEASPVEAAPVVPARPVAPVVVLPESRIAGAHHKLSFAERAALQPGQRLIFRRDTGNRYDKRAILIELVEDGQEPRALGFVARHENRTICDLIEAGHEVAGELIEPDRFTLHNRIRPGEEPDTDFHVIEEVRRFEDGGRIMRGEVIRPRYRAWIATGQVGNARPPAPDEIPGEPDWVRLEPEHKASLNYDTHFNHPVEWHAGMELTVKPQSWVGAEHLLVTLSGQIVGKLEGRLQALVTRVLAEGRQVRVVVTGVTQQLWSGHPPTPCPLVELRATRRPLPPGAPAPALPPLAGTISLHHLPDGALPEVAGHGRQAAAGLDIFARMLHELFRFAFVARDLPVDGPDEIGGRLDLVAADISRNPVLFAIRRPGHDEPVSRALAGFRWMLDHRDAIEDARAQTYEAYEARERARKAAGQVGIDWEFWLTPPSQLDWSAPRLFCVTPEFSPRDAQALSMSPYEVELVRWRRFGNQLILLRDKAAPREDTI
jgi:hypothetical protein